MININIFSSLLLYLLFNISNFKIFIIGGTAVASLIAFLFIFYQDKYTNKKQPKAVKILIAFTIFWVITQILNIISGNFQINISIIIKNYIYYFIIIYIGTIIYEKIKQATEQWEMPKALKTYLITLTTTLIIMTTFYLIAKIGASYL